MTKEQWLGQRQDFDRTLYTLRQLRKPIFAAVNGIAYGGGCEIAQSTDFIISSDTATFGQPEAMLGLAAGGGSPALLPRLLPPGKALRMQMTGDPITAHEANRLGMVNEIYPQKRAHDRGCPPHRREDRQQLTDSSTGSQGESFTWARATNRASDRDHDGGTLALGCSSRPHRRHRRVQRRPRAPFSRRRLLTVSRVLTGRSTRTLRNIATASTRSDMRANSARSRLHVPYRSVRGAATRRDSPRVSNRS